MNSKPTSQTSTYPPWPELQAPPLRLSPPQIEAIYTAAVALDLFKRFKK